MTELSDFIDDARKVALQDVFDLCGGVLGRLQGGEHVGPCPACGGRDRFSVSLKKGVWHCRHHDGGSGGDGLALMAHKMDLNLNRRPDFLVACSEVQGGRPIPDGGERESDEDRAAREKRVAERHAAAEAKRRKDDTDANVFRDKEIAKARGIFGRALDGMDSPAADYLRRRTGAGALPFGLWENLAFLPDHTYWHGQDARGNPVDIHCGPALIAPMVDLSGRVTGCHQTWIDLEHGPKFRPDLGLDEKGEPLPTKKMRGHSKGSLIPVIGALAASRWVVGEGIETVLAVAAFEGWREDTFYAAAGSLGNIAGPSAGSIKHPVSKKQDVKGRWRPVMVAGPMPKPGSEADCFQLPSHVVALTLLGDRDSEEFFTICGMLRAETRLARDGLAIKTEWPPPGFGDFADFHLSYMTQVAA